ncbi:insulin-like growth factor 1 receptor [Dendronephthya gigantea]|uniref:insulin-like growth factor 1 receptor n=1 Tax=Dendronephthya gigantea TaxID=151771 RepID=UPI00106CDC54|nr:insulin-like growth factor 1 receptor [Dendronephthya gigantea]
MHFAFKFSSSYALAIFDNPNLESLWEFHPNFKINNRNPKTINGMFVQLNPRLCLKNIYPLVEDVLKWNKSDPNVDISETTNGNARNCDVNFVNLTITGRQKCFKPGLCVKVSWPNKVEDYRNLILYSVWYRETTSTDLNEYDDIDACNSDHVWERQDVSSKRRPIISGTVYGLKAHTLYAFRVKAIVIGGTGVKSYITYFKTRQTKPSVPRSHEVSYLSSSSLQVKWREPFFPNGEITHYLVKYKESSSSSYLWNLNINVDWCQNIDSSINFYKKKKVKDKLTSGNQTCPVNLTCNCDNEKDEKQSLDLKEALFAKEFQDKILQEVFKKNDTNNNKITTTPRPCGNYSKNSSCSTQRPNTQELSTSISTTPTSVLSTTTAPLVILNTTQQTIILEGLKYFTEYSVEVCACNSGAGCGENRGYVTQCSTVLGRTGKSDTADDVGDTLTFDAYNDSKQFTLTWKAPDRPNGKVLRYDVWIQYKPIKGNETVDDQQCVIDAEYIKKGASFGDYTAKVRAITPVGNGSWSNQVNFRIDEKITPPGIEAQKEDANFVTVVGVSVGAILFALVVFVVLTFSLVKRHKKSKHGAGVLFSSTNPEYWNCSDVYVPDEWEVPRGDVTLIRELGNGSFGMVWEGEAVGILPGVHSCKVAVKTVSDTSSIRDKVEFLKEASIMKAFNCNHVLRLLGVVSAGDPVLVIMELMENGDLKSFLRKRRPDSEEDCSLPPPTNVELFQMAAEIADGMAYLADRKFVHRDLAARNCMVSGNQTCKIGDFGLARDVYETDYYRKGTKGFLPVRWMSPESLRDGVFCSASDVWSYGVVLWEMATLAEQPYQGKSNEEVMKFVLDGNIMDIPESYPRKLLEIMLLCWQQKPRNRPTFLSIVENLEGYLTLDFTERSFYHNGRPRKETDSSSLVSLGTENDNLSELPDFLTDHAPKSPIPRESFV